jgi:hypothetical protein
MLPTVPVPPFAGEGLKVDGGVLDSHVPSLVRIVSPSAALRERSGQREEGHEQLVTRCRSMWRRREKDRILKLLGAAVTGAYRTTASDSQTCDHNALTVAIDAVIHVMRRGIKTSTARRVSTITPALACGGGPRLRGRG